MVPYGHGTIGYGIEHIKLPAKLLDYFLRSNKSNINQPYAFYGTIDLL